LVVRLEGLGVVATLIAEQLSECLLAFGPLDESIPVVMSDFVSNVSKERAIRFVEDAATLLSLGIVGFSNVDANHTVLVASQHTRRRRVSGIRQELDDPRR
jgi:hypothetical protein